MKKDRKKTYLDILKATRVIVLRDNDKLNEYKDWVYSKYNVPREVVSDIVCEKIEETEATSKDFILYCLIDGIEQAEYIKSPIKVVDYFTEIEIKQYSNAKYVEETITFPLRIPAFQVESDQWVAAVDTDFILLLRKAGLIKYNSETQRPLKRIVNGENVSFKIEINETAINGIIDSYKNNYYIPNTWTLNIADESEADFIFDEEKSELVIRSIDHFDISDGYHRYIALCRYADVNPNFKTHIILQVTQYDETKAKSFIYQQDLKTKMKRVAAASLNMRATEVKICERLNESPLSSLQGQIRRNGGLVNLPQMSKCIKSIILKDKKNFSQKEIRDLSNNMRIKLNDLTAFYPELLDREWSYEEIVIAVYLCNFNDEKKFNGYTDYVKEFKLRIESSFKSKSAIKLNNTILHMLKDIVG